MERIMTRVNIRPGVSMLSVLRNLKYTHWYALAEFVDNALQSYLANKPQLAAADPNFHPLVVTLDLSARDGGALVIRDNAAGIASSEFPRAFKPAALPDNRAGLSEFGMGMKAAACWCAHTWSVRTKPLNDANEYSISFNIDEIVARQIEDLDITPSRAASPSHHFTEVKLQGLHQIPTGRTLGKIKQHLADIYRDFIRRGELVLRFNDEELTYEEPRILDAPYFRDETGPSRRWRKEINFDFGNGLSAHGFAAIRETASTSRAGFALFRRGRVIQGSGDEGYRPETIFRKSNSFEYQRIFGELHLEGFEVTHTKDGFKWDDNEEVFLELLKDELSKEELPLLQQAKGYRVGERRENLQAGAEEAAANLAQTLERNAPDVVADLREDQAAADVPAELVPATLLTRRVIDLTHAPWTWRITIEQTANAAADWLELAEEPSRPDRNQLRTLALRVSLAHPFMQRFAGSDPDQIEPLLRLAAALALSEVIAREGADPGAFGRIRENVNTLLRRALAAP
jgi:hypothetical protein